MLETDREKRWLAHLRGTVLITARDSGFLSAVCVMFAVQWLDPVTTTPGHVMALMASAAGGTWLLGLISAALTGGLDD